MKEAENNEIDALLRNLARRAQTAPSAGDSVDLTAKGAHLDVDELSSYAERALPPSARARCTAHLADCDDCRKIVVQLSLAAGPLVEEHKEAAGVVVGLTWTQKLAKLFSPQVIRYAMPVLVLVVVAVAFFGWRQQRQDRSEFVARNESSKVAPATASGSEQPTAANQFNEPTRKPGEAGPDRTQKEAKTETPSASPATRAGKGDAAETTEEKKPSGTGSTATAPAKAAKQDAAPADKKAAEPSYAPEPAPASPKPESNAAVNQEQQKDQARNNAADDRERGRDANVQRKGPARNDNDIAQRGPAKTQAQQQPVDKLKAAETGSTAGARSEEDESDRRSMFGRHFHRVNNAWVDTAYKTSMAIKSFTRGTDEYHALIADEPVIGNIGKQLSGEVIVVWKGHAYRIN